MIRNTIRAILSLTFVVVLPLSAFAYEVKPEQPGTNVFNWNPHETLTSSVKTCAKNAASTWNQAPGDTPFSCGSTTYGAISWYDTYSEVAYETFYNYPGLPSSAVGVCVTVGPYYSNFDIILNSSETFAICTRLGQNANDYQGVFTHEFGHAIGLADRYTTVGSGNYFPTMYGNNAFNGINTTYAFRDLLQDDKDGKIAVESYR